MLVSAAALLWVTGSLIVAFPTEAFTLKLSRMITTFATNAKHPFSLIVLIFIDLVIVVVCIRDQRVRAGITHWLGAILVCFLIFFVSAMWGPIMAPGQEKNYGLFTGSLALLALAVARGFTYAAPQQATPVSDLPIPMDGGRMSPSHDDNDGA
ncbi:MAG: hypothetical protein KDJ86_19360 [Bauldia sp.]|uniref:hypothetical protein n=1 Tax=Bauldia sp. TaxID=2575872 RepID=UPI001D2F9ED8|nr:hypothetical protein [Bauldia sp.]MCB1497951.1 hypothetical protein [Bauldia sp.]